MKTQKKPSKLSFHLQTEEFSPTLWFSSYCHLSPFFHLCPIRRKFEIWILVSLENKEFHSLLFDTAGKKEVPWSTLCRSKHKIREKRLCKTKNLFLKGLIDIFWTKDFQIFQEIFFTIARKKICTKNCCVWYKAVCTALVWYFWYKCNLMRIL